MSNIMPQFTSAGGRITFFRTEKNISQQKLADLIGVSRGYIGDIERDRSEPSSNFLTLIASKLDVNIDWVLTGRGNMLISQPLAQSGVIRDDLEGDKAWEDFDLVPFYDVEASAGAGAFVDQELKISDMAFRKDWLRLRGLKAAHCALIKARGDSMEPTIHDGDLLLVDRSVEIIKDDAIYIIQADHHLIVKRIQQTVDGALIVISDNGKYVNQTFDAGQAEKIKVAGRVRWYGHEI